MKPSLDLSITFEKIYPLLVQALEQTADAVFITNPEGKILYVNYAFETMTGFSKSEAIGQTPAIINSGQHNQVFHNKLWKTITSGKTFRNVVINKKKSGEIFYSDHTISPILDSQNQITHFVATWKDITKERRLQQQKDEFISVVSHELKTPITSLSLYLQRLEAQLHKSNSSLTEHIKPLQNQVSRIQNLISELVELTHLDANRLKTQVTNFNLVTLIQEIASELLVANPDRSLSLTLPNQLNLISDPDRISQVLTNLISNAFKYSPPKSPVIISLTPSATSVTVSVIDQGSGISKEHQDQLFQRFYRVSTKTKQPGLGLGLYISSEITKRLGGRLWLKKSTSSGSEFAFELPLKPDSA